MKKILLSLAVLSLLSFINTGSIQAAGINRYTCKYVAANPLALRCVPDYVICDIGYEAGNECASHASSPDDCNTEGGAGWFPCVPINQCGGLGQDCCTTGAQCGSGLICASGVCAQNQSGVGAAGNPLCPGANEIDTAIGCIPVEKPSDLIGFLLPWGIGIAGGIAFLLIIYAGFLIMSSAGDPHRLQAGKELLTAAFSGLILLIFSVFLLRLIGVNILGIFK